MMVGACGVLFILLQLTVKSEARSLQRRRTRRRNVEKSPVFIRLGDEGWPRYPELSGVWYDMAILMVS